VGAQVRSLLRFVATIVLASLGLALGVGLLAGPAQALFRRGGTAVRADIDKTYEPSERSYVYAADGSLLAVLHAEENRSPVTLDRVPAIVVNAVLDVEDERFWAHGAVDLRATLRAFATNAQSGSVLQGGSTITQQLVKNLLLTPERHIDRKVKEAVLALQVEQDFTKQQILERYLNIVYFGAGAYGVQAAAETYFGVDVSKLDAVQAAFLAGMISNPVGYDPLLNPKLSTARRNKAIDRMVFNGHVTAAEGEVMKTVPVPSSVHQLVAPKDDYFVEEVKQRLLADTRLGETATERYNAVFRGGLRIHTNLDPRLQRLAEEKVRAGVPPNKEGFTAALVAIEPSTGKVRALVGGPGYDKSKFDLATQAYRQPGSSFKVFTLLAMLEAGFGPASTVDGAGPCSVKFPGFPRPTPIANSEGEGGGTVSVSNATALSINCAFIRIAANVGLKKVADMARRLGVGTDPGHLLDEVPAMVIGSEEATPLQMASAYTTLAADGVRHVPTFIDKVLDRKGKEVLKVNDDGKRVLSSEVSRVTVQMLKGVVTSGTGTQAQLPRREVAGKTGTTDDYSNAWFVGFTPQLATAVWMGSPSGNVPMRDVGGIRVFGGTYPAKMWHDFMAGALDGAPVLRFPLPDPGLIPPATDFQTPGELKRPQPLQAQAPVSRSATTVTTPPLVVPSVPAFPTPTFPGFPVPPTMPPFPPPPTVPHPRPPPTPPTTRLRPPRPPVPPP